MKLAPSQWQGSARQLITEILQPQFIPAARIELWQNLLKRKMEEADPVYMVGTPAPELRSRWGHEQVHLTRSDAKVVFSDRAPATAVFTYLSGVESISPEKATALLMHLPHHVFDLDKFTRWAALTNNIASAGWLAAHLFPGSSADANWESLSREELKKKTIRHLHPLNIFIFPNLNKSGTVFADDPRFHALMAETYRTHYGNLFDEYLALTGDNPGQWPAPEDFTIDLSAATTAPAGVKIESKDLVSKIEPSQAFDLKLLTINESQGYHSRVLDPAQLNKGFYDIKLEFKEKSGETKTIGFYRLNLKDLYERQFLARDAKGVRLLAHKTEQGFAIGPKKTGPLVQLP